MEGFAGDFVAVDEGAEGAVDGDQAERGGRAGDGAPVGRGGGGGGGGGEMAVGGAVRWGGCGRRFLRLRGCVGGVGDEGFGTAAAGSGAVVVESCTDLGAGSGYGSKVAFLRVRGIRWCWGGFSDPRSRRNSLLLRHPCFGLWYMEWIGSAQD